jgi:hypothetical protein
MTEAELRQLDELWAGALPIKQIARLMCYSFDTIAGVLKSNRGRYPLRRKSFTQDERDAWADRVLSGELTPIRAAELAGCGASAVRKWVKERGAR